MLRNKEYYLLGHCLSLLSPEFEKLLRTYVCLPIPSK